VRKYTLKYKSPPTFDNYKKSAQKIGREFSITRQEFEKITSKNCHYCNEPGPNGIDRKDNGGGYFKKNCLPCCKHCNYARGALTYPDFRKWLKRFRKV